MIKMVKKRSQKSGLPPGTLLYVGEKKVEEPEISVIHYDESHCEEKVLKNIEDTYSYKDTPAVTWINVDGLHNVDLIEKLGTQFGFHPLVMEDILNTEQRAKIEDYGDYMYIVLRMIYSGSGLEDLEGEQVSIVLTPNLVISFQERRGDVFESVRERIRKSKGRISKLGADFLAYALMDAIVDNYFNVLERAGETIENVEEQLTLNPSPSTLHKITRLKKEMVFLRKSVWPVRELINNLTKSESDIITKNIHEYLRDIYDHTIQVMDTIESYRDIISGMLDIYLSSISNKMNEVMKVLTIFASIFIPLTFIAGVYGMNFKFMPELDWPWGYFAVLSVMAAVSVVMIIYFKRRRWF
jgi:magnesium transporter